MRTNEELAAELNATIRAESEREYFTMYDADVNIVGDGSYLDIEMTIMYRYIPETPEIIQRFREILGTDDVHMREGGSTEGCESCDYGSQYTVILTAKGVKR